MASCTLGPLGGSPIGRLVPITGTDPHTRASYERVAYVPEPLPRELTLAAGTWTRVAAAEAALARLDQAGQQIPESALLRRPALRREAQSTSALEGTFAPFDSVIASETEDRGALPVELREVLNYVVAAEEGFARVAERPLTIGLIEHLQQVLVANTPSELRDAGRVREQQVVIGSRGRPIAASRFVPPPPGDQLRGGLEDWLSFVRDPPEDLRRRAAGISGVAERVAAELIGSPIVTAPAVGRRHEISAQGAMFALRRLASIGLMRQERVGSRVAFRADGVLDLLRD